MKDKNIFQFQQFTIVQHHAAMKVGTDSDLLGALAEGGQRILDVGTGTGVLALIMAQRNPGALVTAVEIDDNAVLDATVNFNSSPFASRITLRHTSFQDFVADCPEASFDCVICNPPYFDNSLECDDLGRKRARHTSSLPFEVLVSGVWQLLEGGGVFSVCIPPEVYGTFTGLCSIHGFFLQDVYWIKTTPRRAPKRLVLVLRKGGIAAPFNEYQYCMLNPDGTRSEWYRDLMRDLLIPESTGPRAK